MGGVWEEMGGVWVRWEESGWHRDVSSSSSLVPVQGKTWRLPPPSLPPCMQINIRKFLDPGLLHGHGDLHSC